MALLSIRAVGEVEITTDGGLAAIDWIIFGVVVVGAVIIALGLARVVRKALRKLAVDETIALLLSRLVASVVVIIGLVYGLSQIGVRVGPLLGAVGLGGIALAFAIQSVLADLLAGIVLHGRRPFGIGDEIDSADQQGTVVDIGARAVELRLYDGSHAFIPNSTVLDNAFTNVTAESLRRSILDVGVAYGTDLDAALRLLVEAATAAPETADSPAPTAHFTAFGDDGIELSLWYWHSPREVVRWKARTAVGLAVESRFAAAGITIPFPQRTLWSGDRPG